MHGPSAELRFEPGVPALEPGCSAAVTHTEPPHPGTVIPISQLWKPKLRNLTPGTCVEELGSVTQSFPGAENGPEGKKGG